MNPNHLSILKALKDGPLNGYGLSKKTGFNLIKIYIAREILGYKGFIVSWVIEGGPERGFNHQVMSRLTPKGLDYIKEHE